MDSTKKTISSDVYDDTYYLTKCGGYEAFQNKADLKNILRHRDKAFQLADIKPGNFILDIGCGRGEILLKSILEGATSVGFDYSRAAVTITRNLIRKHLPEDIESRILLICCSAMNMPFPSESFDRAFCLDVVEHLNEKELSQCLKETFRILRPGGKLVITTSPNIWATDYGYRISLIPRMLMERRILPWKKPRGDIHKYHINEQNVISLKRYLKRAGFQARVWPQPEEKYHGTSKLKKILFPLFCEKRPLSYLFCQTIFAVACKKN